MVEKQIETLIMTRGISNKYNSNPSQNHCKPRKISNAVIMERKYM